MSRRFAIMMGIIFLAAACSPAPTPTPLPPTSTPAPTLAPTLAATPTEKKPEAATVSLFDALLQPFATEAQQRKSERAKSDPEQVKRIDRDLNEGRINFLLYGYGETHEPPVTERAIVGSNTVISYNLKTRTVDLISFTHDIRAPEIERELKTRGQKVTAVRMDQAYNVGGFRLMRKLLEDMTGLSMDFQVTFKDAVLGRFVDNVFGGVEIDVPETFTAHAFYLDGKKYPQARFEKGKQTLNGNQVIQYIKTTPVSEGYYGKSLELNVRKHQILEALLEGLSKKSAESGFWLKTSTFLTGELVTGAVVSDFDPIPLAVNNIGSIIANLNQYLARGESTGLGLPKISKTIYIADPSNGDGGVRWVDGDKDNPHTLKDFWEAVYPENASFVIPFNSNSRGDLVTEYWTSVRTLIKKSLTEK